MRPSPNAPKAQPFCIEPGGWNPTLAAVNGQSLLLLLVRVNVLNWWRRLKSVHKTSGAMALAVVSFVVAYQALSFLLFSRVFRFVNKFPALGALLLERLFFLLFAFLLVLLLFSNLVIGYGNFFRNRETQFLFNLPVPARVVFQWKFIESTALITKCTKSFSGTQSLMSTGRSIGVSRSTFTKFSAMPESTMARGLPESLTFVRHFSLNRYGGNQESTTSTR